MPYSFQSRPWELKTYYSIDILDSIMSSLRVDVVNNKVIRILPCLNELINEEWITNKARFSYDSLLIQKLQQPMFILHGSFFPISWELALTFISVYLYLYKYMYTEVICGPFII